MACNSGGSSNKKGNSFVISSVVSAPGGAIAQLQYKTIFPTLVDTVFRKVNAALTGTAPVANATVELIKLDNNGNQTGEVIATTMTTESGAFSFNTTQSASSKLAVRVDSGVATVRAIVASTDTDINPLSEYALTQIESVVASDPNIDFSYFSNEEVVDLYEAADFMPISLVSTTLAGALGEIDAAVGTSVSSEMSRATINLTGTWSYVETVGPNTCGEAQGSIWDSNTLSVTQSMNSVSVYVNGQLIARGNLQGTDIYDLPLDSYSEMGGLFTETSQSFSVALDGNSGQGVINWT